MFAIARSELLQIFRNRLVLVTGLIIPVVVSAFFVYQHEIFADQASLGYIAAVVVFTVMAFGLYATAVTTLASRRQNLFLKRLRSTAASDADILIGLVLPVTVIALVQTVAILAVFGVVAVQPAQVPLLAVAVLATLAMMVALALATAGLTNSPEHAQVTTLPVSLTVIAVASWVGSPAPKASPCSSGCCPEDQPPSSSSTHGTAALLSPTPSSYSRPPSRGYSWRSRSPRNCSAGNRASDDADSVTTDELTGAADRRGRNTYGRRPCQ